MARRSGGKREEGRAREERFWRLARSVRAYQTAVDKMDDAVSAAMGLNRTDSRCFDILDQLGPITAGSLAEQAGITSGAVTAVVDRLEEKGFVRRVADPRDRRRVLVEPTEEGRQRAYRLYEGIKLGSAEMIDRLSDEQIELLIEFNDFGRELNEREARRIRDRIGKEG